MDTISITAAAAASVAPAASPMAPPCISHAPSSSCSVVASTAAATTTTTSYPRTGKRGVPQQFARRLYEMLQTEEKLALSSPSTSPIYIAWSSSGQAFKIMDVDEFTIHVLPKYFRTNKFSSFQRNLNLYGFSKVRRGPDTDMYAHPSFIRGKPELLHHLRKCPTASRNRDDSTGMNKNDAVARTLGAPASPPPSRRPLKKRNKAARQQTILLQRSVLAARAPTSSSSSSTSTCYESDDHSTGGTVISHEEGDATTTSLVERAGLNASQAAVAMTASAHEVFLKKTKASPTYAYFPRSLSGAVPLSQSVLVSPGKFVVASQHQKPLLLMPKATVATATANTNSPINKPTPSFKPILGGLDMLAMAVDFA